MEITFVCNCGEESEIATCTNSLSLKARRSVLGKSTTVTFAIGWVNWRGEWEEPADDAFGECNSCGRHAKAWYPAPTGWTEFDGPEEG